MMMKLLHRITTTFLVLRQAVGLSFAPFAHHHYSTALVRAIPDSCPDALSSSAEVVDLERARQQHDAYCRILRDTCGLRLIEIPQPEYTICPDACFVEDTAIVLSPSYYLLSSAGHAHAPSPPQSRSGSRDGTYRTQDRGWMPHLAGYG